MDLFLYSILIMANKEMFGIELFWLDRSMWNGILFQ